MEERKIKKSFPRKFGLLLGTAFFAVLMFFTASERASAASKALCNSATSNATHMCAAGWTIACGTSEADCQSWCDANRGWFARRCSITPYDPKTNSLIGSMTFKENGKSVSDIITDPLLTVVKYILYQIFKFFAWMLGVAAVLFGWIIDPNNIKFIMGNEGLYASWAMVRDFLNLGFVLVLLYIAFCVVFQIGSYSDSWKRMLLMMIIMALLANFSFPICRFIIDVSNIIFYWILNVGFPSANGSAMFNDIAGSSGYATVLANEETYKGASVSYLLAIIIFTFILALTFLVIAALFVIRLTAIGVLIIFSPIGITGAAFPWSQKYASQWWDKLFKYAFFAPIMAFMLLVAFNIMNLMRISGAQGTMITATQGQLDPEASVTFIASMAYFMIPIVILWTGLHAAQSLSIVGAKSVTAMADKTAKWAGKKFSGYNWAKRRVDAFTAERKKRADEKFKGNVGTKLANWTNAAQDTVHANLMLPGREAAGRRATKWRREHNRGEMKTAREEAENMKSVDLITHLNTTASNPDETLKHGGYAQELISRGKELEDKIKNARRSTVGEDIAGIRINASIASDEEAMSKVRDAIRDKISAAEVVNRNLVIEAGKGIKSAVVTGAAVAGGAAAVAAVGPAFAAAAGGAVATGWPAKGSKLPGSRIVRTGKALWGSKNPAP